MSFLILIIIVKEDNTISLVFYEKVPRNRILLILTNTNMRMILGEKTADVHCIDNNNNTEFI